MSPPHLSFAQPPDGKQFSASSAFHHTALFYFLHGTWSLLGIFPFSVKARTLSESPLQSEHLDNFTPEDRGDKLRSPQHCGSPLPHLSRRGVTPHDICHPPRPTSREQTLRWEKVLPRLLVPFQGNVTNKQALFPF